MSKKEIIDSKQQIKFEPLRKDLKLFENTKIKSKDSNWILFDPVADKYFKLGNKEHLILSFFSDSSTVEELCSKVKKIDCSISETDINSVIGFLHSNNLLQPSLFITEHSINKVRAMKKAAFFNKLLYSYLFFRIPLWKPDKFLTNSLYIIQAICNKWVILIISLFAVSGYIALVVNWNIFESTIIETLNYSGMLKYGLTIVFLKVFHELGHAYAAKNAGIRVRRFGLGFIVFFPRFFTDITDSWRLECKSRKLLIDAAGILVELTIGGLAILFWVYSGPGIVKTISYYVFAVSIINTVLVNGNPFIRYDGYYILMDSIGIDNLQQRSRLLIVKAFRELLFGIKTSLPFNYKGWQKYLIIIYGISGFIYRIFLYTGIILIVYYKFTKVVGIVLVFIEAYLLILKPMYSEMKNIFKLKKKADGRQLKITIAAVCILLLILFVPLPWTVSLPCVVGSSKDNIVYVKESGFLKTSRIVDEKLVTKDELLFQLENPYLKYEEKELKFKKMVKETELDQLKNYSDIKISESLSTKNQQIALLENTLKENIRKQNLLSIKSPIDGTFVVFDWRMKPGKWLEKGTPIGEVFSDKILIYAYADEEYIDKFKLTEKVKIYLDDNIDCFYGQIAMINPIPTKEWTPSPLLDTAGGTLPVLKKESAATFILKNYYYQITIRPEKEYQNLKFSRTGFVQVREYSSMGLNFIRSVISTLQRELSF